MFFFKLTKIRILKIVPCLKRKIILSKKCVMRKFYFELFITCNNQLSKNVNNIFLFF